MSNGYKLLYNTSHYLFTLLLKQIKYSSGLSTHDWQSVQNLLIVFQPFSWKFISISLYILDAYVCK